MFIGSLPTSQPSTALAKQPRRLIVMRHEPNIAAGGRCLQATCCGQGAMYRRAVQLLNHQIFPLQRLPTSSPLDIGKPSASRETVRAAGATSGNPVFPAKTAPGAVVSEPLPDCQMPDVRCQMPDCQMPDCQLPDTGASALANCALNRAPVAAGWPGEAVRHYIATMPSRRLTRPLPPTEIPR
jgi:hypothetical protein